MLGYVLDAVAGPGLQEQLDIPSPAPGEALIRVLRSGVCSTDLEMILGYKDGFQGVLGHEFVGVVEAVESAADGPGTRDDAKQWIGQRVVGEINIVHDAQLPLYGISAAAAPKDLVRNHSPTRTCLGIVGKDGTHAEYITLPLVNLLPVPDTVNDSSAVFCEPLAAACRIVEQGLISCADRVAIVGDGKLGLLIAEVLGRQSLETRPVLFGRHESKMSLVAEICDTRLAPREGEPLTGDSAGLHFDCVVESSGSVGGLVFAAEIARPLGTVVLKTTCAPDDSAAAALAAVSNSVVVKELRILGSRCGPHPMALEMLAKPGLLDVQKYIEAEYDLNEADAAFEHAKRRGALKVQIVMPSAIGSQTKPKDRIARAAGVAGVGSQRQLSGGCRNSVQALCGDGLGLCTCSRAGTGGGVIFQLRL